MKKHKLIGFALWTAENTLLILRLREYLMIAPVLAVQVVIWICCSVLFLMDVSSRGIRISINIIAILVGLLAIFYILYFRQQIAWLTLISSAITIEHLLDELGTTNSTTTVPTHPHIEISNEASANTSLQDITNDYDKICFYVTPIGEENSEQRKHSDMLLECIVSPVLEQYGLKAVRADQIDKPGIITNQILDYLTKARMVIADLSYHNPNVFYELAVRHMKGLPTIHLSRSSDKIPFDIGNFRTITLDMSDLYTFVPQIETYKSQISAQLRSLLDANGDGDNPISAYLSRSTKKE